LASSVHLNTSSTLYWNSLEAKKCTCFGCSQQSDWIIIITGKQFYK